MSDELANVHSGELVTLETPDAGQYLPTVKEIDQGVEVYKRIRHHALELLDEGTDYGRIPGVSKKCLFKPGAEKLCNFFGFSVESETIKEKIDWDSPYAFFRVKTFLRLKKSGQIAATGIGSINSRETKYVSQVKNGKFADLLNTWEKMAQKRSHIDATLRGTGLSEIFTQDVEDMPRGAVSGDSPPAESEVVLGKKVVATMESTRDGGFCCFCKKKHIKQGEVIIKLEGDKYWGAEACAKKQGGKPEKPPDTPTTMASDDGIMKPKELDILDKLFESHHDTDFWKEFKETHPSKLTFGLYKKFKGLLEGAAEVGADPMQIDNSLAKAMRELDI